MLIVGADLKTSTFAATFTQLRSISKKSFGWAKMPRSTLLKLFCLTRIVLSNLNGSPIPQWTTKEPLRGAHARGHGPWSRVHGRHDAWTESVSLHRPLFFLLGLQCPLRPWHVSRTLRTRQTWLRTWQWRDVRVTRVTRERLR